MMASQQYSQHSVNLFHITIWLFQSISFINKEHNTLNFWKIENIEEQMIITIGAC